VAGIIGGTKYGVAKKANLISVEVLDCAGNGTWSKLLAGIDWVLANKGNKPAVANMSLSGTKSWIVNWAIDDLSPAGVLVAIAAGNDNTDACKYSPASATSVVTTAANRGRAVERDQVVHRELGDSQPGDQQPLQHREPSALLAVLGLGEVIARVRLSRTTDTPRTCADLADLAGPRGH
jgi:subtilisin family serine protease